LVFFKRSLYCHVACLLARSTVLWFVYRMQGTLDLLNLLLSYAIQFLMRSYFKVFCSYNYLSPHLFHSNSEKHTIRCWIVL
jgi:lipopolysaccharide export LptBFGC system permease protein LptF